MREQYQMVLPQKDGSVVVEVGRRFSKYDSSIWRKECCSLSADAFANSSNGRAALIDQSLANLNAALDHIEHMADVGRCRVNDPDIEAKYRAGMQRQLEEKALFGRIGRPDLAPFAR